MMNTMTAKSLEQSLPFPLKQEQDFILEDIDNDDATLDEINSLLSMPLPSISGKNFHVPTEPNNEFLRLTTMNEELPCNELKKCTDELELNAVRCSLEASLYRQNMLRLISDIKSHTSERKVYKKLLIFLETPPDKVDVGIQTDNSWYDLEKADNIQSVCISSNCEELSPLKQICSIEQSVLKTSDLEDTLLHSDNIKTASPTVNSTSCYERENIKSDNESDEEKRNKMIVEETLKQKAEVTNQEQVKNNSDSLVGQTDQSVLHNEDENSQDSLLQHMEDMFCESDDSSDLTTLIEKHSGVSKANIDKEINKMCLENSNFFTVPSSSQASENKKDNKANAIKKSHANQQGRFSFSYYKEMKSRGADKLVPSKDNETAEAKQKRKMNGIWFVERVHQVSKLKAKMTELSLRNYRKHGRVKQRFIELFGESDEEDMMPDSPICIEEHLTSCKERIAPWIVKYLMPFYKKRRIKDRQLFKAVAKHIADMLIIENTFPEQDCVSKYIEGYFRNKKFIKTKQDIYL